MVGMIDYHLHYALMATEDRVRDSVGPRRGNRPIRPRSRILRLPPRDSSRR